VRDVVAADGIHRPCAGPPWRHCHPVKLSRCDWLGELNKGAHDPICVLRPLSRSQPARVPKPCTSTTRHLVELKALRAQLEGLRLGRGHPLPRAAAPWARAVSRGARRYGGGRGSQPRRWCWLLAAAVAGWRRRGRPARPAGCRMDSTQGTFWVCSRNSFVCIVTTTKHGPFIMNPLCTLTFKINYKLLPLNIKGQT
jgi:hypothetical protein